MIKSLIKRCVGAFGKGLNKAGLLPKDIILYMDGGICSQMHFYLVGEMLRARGNNVIYDLQWFKDNGMDCDGKFCRNFDLLKLFPDLRFPKMKSKAVRKLYEWSVPYKNDYFDNETDPLCWLDYRGPMYLTGYFHDPQKMFSEYFPRLFKLDTNILSGPNMDLLKRIEAIESECDTCAVHVRRGDLAEYKEAYGNPASTDYFRNAMERVAAIAADRGRNIRFFIFSDEPDYVRQELMPMFNNKDVELCQGNGSDRGYCDLALISRCRHIITSQGSLGKYGAMLRPQELTDGMVTLMHTDHSTEWISRFKNTAVIN